MHFLPPLSSRKRTLVFVAREAVRASPLTLAATSERRITSWPSSIYLAQLIHVSYHENMVLLRRVSAKANTVEEKKATSATYVLNYAGRHECKLPSQRIEDSFVWPITPY